MHRGNERQRVTLEEMEAEAASAARAGDLRLTKAVLARIEEAANLVAARGGDPVAMLSVGARPSARRR